MYYPTASPSMLTSTHMACLLNPFHIILLFWGWVTFFQLSILRSVLPLIIYVTSPIHKILFLLGYSQFNYSKQYMKWLPLTVPRSVSTSGKLLTVPRRLSPRESLQGCHLHYINSSHRHGIGDDEAIIAHKYSYVIDCCSLHWLHAVAGRHRKDEDDDELRPLALFYGRQVWEGG